MNNELILPGYTRITDVLKPFARYQGIDQQTLDRAADRGTRVHAFCDAFAHNPFLTDVDPDCKPYFEAFCRWFESMVDKVIFTERRIYDLELKITGKPDLVCILKGDTLPTLVDYKTCVSIQPTFSAQTAAYRKLAKEYGGVDCHRRICLMLPSKPGNAKVVEYSNHFIDEMIFMNCLKLHRHFNGFTC